MRRVLVSAGAVGVLVLSSCAWFATPGSPAEQRAGGSILLAAPSDPDAMMDALITGTLTRTADGCLALEQEGRVYVLQFPYGSLLADDGASVEVPGAGTLRLGDAIEGGGGYVDVPEAPEECRTGPEFAVWQSVNG